MYEKPKKQEEVIKLPESVHTSARVQIPQAKTQIVPNIEKHEETPPRQMQTQNEVTKIDLLTLKKQVLEEVRREMEAEKKAREEEAKRLS